MSKTSKKRSSQKKQQPANEAAEQKIEAIEAETTSENEENAPEISEQTEDNAGHDVPEKPASAQKKKKLKINTRSLKHFSLSAAFTVIFIAAVVLVNVIVAVISDRVGIAADLTGGSLYTLDETTEKYLKEQLSADVTITVLNSEQTFRQSQNTRQVSEILERMENASGHIDIKYLNLDQNPNYVSQFGGEMLDTDYIVVECEKTGRHRIITPTEYFGLDSEEEWYYY